MSTEPLPVYIKDNFLSNNECQNLIDFFDKHHASIGTVFDDRKLINIQVASVELSNDKAKNDADYLKFFQKKLDVNIHSIEPRAFINYATIACRSIGNFQLGHLDFDYHEYTSIIYLNDDFEGGETRVGTEIIKPKKGTILTFQGNVIEHEVLPIIKGTRYNVLVWYKCF